MGVSFSQLQHYDEARFHFDQALRIQPDHPIALSNRGMVLLELGEHEAALASIRRSTQVKPENNPLAWHNLGIIFEHLERYQEALECYGRALHQDPTHEDTHLCRGVVFKSIGDCQSALHEFTRQIEIGTHEPKARFNRGTINLALGNLADGFADYEGRLLIEDPRPPLYGPFPQPFWQAGEDISDKTLLVAAEHGIGDSIQFLRYLPRAVGRAAFINVAMKVGARAMGSIALAESFEGFAKAAVDPEHPAFAGETGGSAAASAEH